MENKEHRFQARFPQDIWDLLAQEAEKDQRSVNVTLERILRERYQRVETVYLEDGFAVHGVINST